MGVNVCMYLKSSRSDVLVAMAQILDPLPPDSSDRILCCYVNATSKVQTARISNVSNWYFERVVFPGQRLVFEALPVAQLEIHSGMMASAILSDTIPCQRLCINDGGDPPTAPDSDSGLEKLDIKRKVEILNKKRKIGEPQAATLAAVS